MKYCSRCQKKKPFDDFTKDKRSADNYSWWCRSCWKQYRDEWNGSAACREDHWKRAGIKNFTLEDYNKLHAAQSGCCAICNRAESELERRLDADHNHETGLIRGLLCSQCNMGIGSFGDDIHRVRNALRYLTKYRV